MLAAYEGHPVAMREGSVLACAFHPELTDDPRFHALFMAMVTTAPASGQREEASELRDPRVENLAQILVGYSTKVKEGEVVSIDGESAAEPLLLAVYEEVLKAGAHPMLNVALDGQIAAYFKHASDAQLDWISPVAEWMVDNVDVRISVGASTNTRELSAVPPERQTRAPVGDRRADGAGDEAQRRGRLPLVLHALPDQRLRVRGRDEPGRLRGLLLRRLPGRPTPTR